MASEANIRRHKITGGTAYTRVAAYTPQYTHTYNLTGYTYNLSTSIYTVSQKNRTLEIFSNISNKAGPISIIFGTENRQ